MALPKLKAYYTKGGKRVDYVYTDPAGGFWVSVERDGKRKRRKCATLSAARHLAENLNILFPEEEKPLKFCEMLLQDLCDRYKDEDERKNKDHAKHRAQEANLIRHLGNISVSEIRRALIPVYYQKRLADGVGPKTANDDVKRLHRLLNMARRDELIEHNPITGYEKLKEPKGRERMLTLEEEARLAEFFRPDDWRLVQIAILSGMRAGEQFPCLVSQVNWDARSIVLRDTKNDETRHIPMSKKLMHLVKIQVERETAWLCPNRSGMNAWSFTNFSRIFRAARDRAGIKDLRWHDLRHTFASRVAMAGVHPKVLQQLLGHKDGKMTARYSHYSDARLREAVDLVELATLGE